MGHQKRMGVSVVATAILAMAALAPRAVAQTGTEVPAWLHVHVEGDGSQAQRVAVNLPLGALGAVVAMAPEHIVSSDGHLRVAERHGVSVSDLRRMWRELMAAGDSEFVAVQNGEQSVRVTRAGDQIQVRVIEEDETVRVDLPVPVVDALLSGEGETLNIAVAVERLRELRGDIVRVVEQERQVRVWIDEQAEQQ